MDGPIQTKMKALPTKLLPPPVPMRGNQPAWREILRESGYPTTVLMLDYETYFDSDYHMISKGGKGLPTVNYVTHDWFEELGHSCLLVTQPFQPLQPSFWRGDENSYFDMLQSEYGKDLEGLVVVSQNAKFDGLITRLRRRIKPRYYIDLLGLARYEESREHNDLGAMAKRFRLPPKGETVRFKGIRLNAWTKPGDPPIEIPAITPEMYALLTDYANHDNWLAFNVFIRLLPRLARPEVELRLMQHTLEMFWEPSLVADEAKATELIGKMDEKLNEIIRVTGHTKEEISGNNSFSTILAAALDQAGDDVKKYQKQNKKGDAILAIAKTDEQLELLEYHPNERVRQLIEARTGIKSWPNHISRILGIVGQARARGGLLGVPAKYSGAHTHRWAGDEKINLQNLPSRNENQIVNEIRHVVAAPEDHELVIVDASQVEARGCAWIAGQEDMCQKFREGAEIYCDYAGRMAGQKLRKSRKTDPEPLKKYLDRMRAMGKVQVLGCQYGMGADKCVAFASNSYGVELTLLEATKLVKTYRDSVPNITKFWRKIEQAFKHTARYHEPTEIPYLKFHYEPEGDITVITLPSGSTLKYPHVRVSIVDLKERLWMPDPQKPGTRIFMWGGYLTENVVQSFCRDFLAEAILECERRGYHVALHIHDELVIVVKKGEGERVLKEVIEILSTPPAWAATCPLAAEGKVTQRYQK